MAGCYGNNKEDHYFEQMLFCHLDDGYDPEELERKIDEAEHYHDLMKEEKLMSPVKWYGFTQDGTIIALGEHETIDDADATEEGGACIWIWNESSMQELLTNIQDVLK